MKCTSRRKGLLRAAGTVGRAAWLAGALVAAASPPAGAQTEGPPGANVGDSPADFAGLAVAVDVGEHTGNATFEYKFEVPAGRNGLQPDLQLMYSHLTKDTDVGYGWEFPFGRIERATHRGVPKYSDTADLLEVTLPNRHFELAHTSGGWAGRVDEMHVWVTATGAGLRMVMPSGVIYTFGDTPESRIQRPNTTLTTANVFAWYLTEVEDPNGNRIDFYYSQNQGYAYPWGIAYGGNPNAGIAHPYSVFPTWDSRSASATRTSCTAGFCRTTAKSLSSITEYEGSNFVRGYRLDWQPSAVNDALLLREVQLLRYDGSSYIALAKAGGSPASTKFQYDEPTLHPWDGSFPRTGIPLIDNNTTPIDWSVFDYLPSITYDEFNCIKGATTDLDGDGVIENGDGVPPSDLGEGTCNKALPFRDWKPEDPCTNRDFVDINADGRPDYVQSKGDYNANTFPYWHVRLNQGRDNQDLFGGDILWYSPRKCLMKRLESSWLYTAYPKFSQLDDEIGTPPCGQFDQNGNPTTNPDERLRCSQVTKEGLVDIDGDGRVEYVDGDQPGGVNYWLVWFQRTDGPGFQTTAVHWPVPKPAGNSMMAGRVYRLDFTEHLVYDFNIVQPANPERYFVIGDEYVPAAPNPSKNYVRIRQRPVQALLDMNGDGRPDLVDVGLGSSVPDQPGSGNYGTNSRGQVRVYWNLGNGFAGDYEELLGGPVGEPIRAGGGEKAQRNVTVEMFDINGDGLRDVVKAKDKDGGADVCPTGKKWLVWYGTGASYPRGHVTLGSGEIPSFDGPHCWDSPTNGELREWNKKRALVDIVDVNADGLPDYVNTSNFKGDPTQRNLYCTDENGDDHDYTCSGPDPTCGGHWDPDYCEFDFPYHPEWRVWINTGAGFVDKGNVFFAKNVRTNRNEKDDNLNYTKTVGLVSDFIDLDGNGYLDNIQTGTAGHLKINYRHGENLLPNMLVKVTNPLGGTTDIAYKVSTTFNTPEVDTAVDANQYQYHLPFPLWVVDSITQSDPPAGENGKVRTRWDYRGGYFSSSERKFFGFRAVDEVQVVPDPLIPGGLYDGPHQYAEFFQTVPLEGKKRLDYTFVDHGFNGLFKEKVFTWNVATGAADGGWTRYFPTLTARLDVDPSSYPTPLWKSKYCPNCGPYATGLFRAKRETYCYDNCGNTTRTIAFDASEGHRVGNPASNTCAATPTPGADVQLKRVDGTFNTAASCNTALRVCTGACDRLLTRTVSGGLSETFTYDARGNQLTSRRNGAGNPTINRSYDTAGNLSSITDARGMVTNISYDAAGHPSQWVVDAGAGHKNHTTTRQYGKFGTVIRHQDPAAAVKLFDYDDFGRLKSVAEPGQSLTTPTRKYSYVIDDGGRSRLEARFLEPTKGGSDPYRVETTFYDALGRKLQRHVHRTVNGVLRAVVLDAVQRDASGSVVLEFEPYVTLDSMVNAFLTLPATAPSMGIVRDEFFREVGRNHADGSTTSTNRKIAWVTTDCDAIHTDNVLLGKCTSKENDALERLVRTDLVLRSDLSPTRRELRTYWPSGEIKDTTLSHITNGTQVISNYSYDALNRLTQKTDPSSGVWNYGYDLNDNMTSEDDPVTGRSLTMTYDLLDRMLTKNESSGVPRTTTLEYDGAISNGAGRLYRVTRSQASGSFTYQDTRNGYDARGNVTSSTQRIGSGSAVRSFTTTNGYDAVGRMVSMGVPAPGGSETLLYDYSTTGDLTAVRSNRNGSYVTGVAYDERERVRGLQYLNGVTETLDYYTADGKDPWVVSPPALPGHGSRIAHIRSRIGTSTPLRQLDYQTFNRDGQATRVWDGAGGAVFQDAVYDDAARLTQWSAPGVSTKTYSYDGFGRLLTKEAKAYTYSATRPFQIATYDGSAVTYDGSGNVSGLPGPKSLAYDAEGNLVTVTEGSAVSQYFYGDGGKRRVKIAPDSTKTYFFDNFDVDPATSAIRRHIRLNGRLVVTSAINGTGVLQTASLERTLPGLPGAFALAFFASCLALPFGARVGRRRFGSRRGVAALLAAFCLAQWPVAAQAQCPQPPFTDTRTYYHLDHLGSPQMLTNATGGKIESTKFLPYGTVADRKNGSGTPITDTQADFGFTGQRKAESHGLAYFEARYYAPDLGIFLSRDAANQFLNPYSYGDGDPLNMRDPTGLSSEDATGDADSDAPPQTYLSAAPPDPVYDTTGLDGAAMGAFTDLELPRYDPNKFENDMREWHRMTHPFENTTPEEIFMAVAPFALAWEARVVGESLQTTEALVLRHVDYFMESDAPVALGRWGDVLASDAAGTGRALFEPGVRWTPEIQWRVFDQLLESGKPIDFVSPLSPENLNGTVFGQEVNTIWNTYVGPILPK